MEYLGNITITGRATVSDPCYEPGTWCTKTLAVKEGTYHCSVERADGRIATLRIQHADSSPTILSEHIGTIGVDSGQCGIWDADYFFRNQGGEYSDERSWYRKVCNLTLSKERGGVVEGLGVVSESGWGDGVYDVFVNKDGDEVTAIEVIFLTEDEEDEDDDCWDEEEDAYWEDC